MNIIEQNFLDAQNILEQFIRDDKNFIAIKEAAKVLLGHTKTDTTEIYLLEEVQEAMKVAKALSS